MNQFIGAAVGFVVGIIATWFFWKYMLVLQPKVSISKQVAKGWSANKKGQPKYRFKIKNNGKRQAINISIVVTICRLKEVPGGKVSSKISTILPKKSISALSSNSESWSPWEIPPIYIFVAKPDFDVENLLAQPDTRILATLSATDSQSGTIHVQRVTYKQKDIVEGNFVKGLGLEIRKLSTDEDALL